MKRFTALSIAMALSISSFAFAESGHMKGMDMHKGKQMDMHGDMKGKTDAKKADKHETTGIVKSVDRSNGKVTLAHEPVKSLKWPAMTMGFAVKDKALFDKLKEGEKVNVEFVQEGSKYIVTGVK